MKSTKKAMLFLLGVILFNFTSCQKDDLETTQQQSKIAYKKITFANLSSRSPKTIIELTKILQKSKTNNFGRGLNENNSYTIDSTSVVYIDNGEGYSSYTFSVIPTQNDTHLQNIVISNYSNGETKAFLAEYELNKTVEQIGDDNFISSIKKTEFYNLNNPTMVYGRGSLCVDLGYEAIVNVCEGELVTPGQNPECFNSDGTPATKKVFIILASACSGSGGDGYGSPSHGDTSPDTSDGPGSGGGTPNPNPDYPTITPEPNPNNPQEPVTVIGDVVTSPTLPSPIGFKAFFSELNLEQQEWLNLTENAEVKNEIRNYLNQNGNTEENTSLMEETINAYMDIENNMLVITPEVIIQNMAEYVECFDLSQGASITIFIDQPIANSNLVISPEDGVGHAFIGISQGSNKSIFGFYPNGPSHPIHPSRVSIMGDDSSHPYDVAITIPVSSTVLQQIINLSINYPEIYNLNSYNCTDFTLEIGNLCGMNFPDCSSSWGIGGGSNPAKFGQYIRNTYPINGIYDVNKNGGNSPQNNKDCD